MLVVDNRILSGPHISGGIHRCKHTCCHRPLPSQSNGPSDELNVHAAHVILQVSGGPALVYTNCIAM
jgi:hypothetical protein